MSRLAAPIATSPVRRTKTPLAGPTVALVAALALVGASPAVAKPAASVASSTTTTPIATAKPKPLYGVRLLSCRRSLSIDRRRIEAGAFIRPLNKGVDRVGVRFDLFSRRDGGTAGWALVPGVPRLGVWRLSDPGFGGNLHSVFRSQQAVTGLYVPVSYRLRVSFRWYGLHGKVLRSAQRTTATCDQLDLRPDLVVRRIDVAAVPGRPGRSSYTALVQNAGLSAARGFVVALATPGNPTAAPHAQFVRVLHAGAFTSVTFTGPVCSGTAPPTVTADSTQVIAERDETNNTLAATCPTTP
jgi:CARDB